jgi:hypothetical protein
LPSQQESRKRKILLPLDALLFRHLATGKRISKEEANYEKQEGLSQDGQSCVKCKFNLPDEKKSPIGEGEIDNEYGISKLFHLRTMGCY